MKRKMYKIEVVVYFPLIEYGINFIYGNFDTLGAGEKKSSNKRRKFFETLSLPLLCRRSCRRCRSRDIKFIFRGVVKKKCVF